MGLGQIEMHTDEPDVLTEENPLNPCVAHHGVDLDEDHQVCEDKSSGPYLS